MVLFDSVGKQVCKLVDHIMIFFLCINLDPKVGLSHDAKSEDESAYKTDDEHYWYDCPWCQEIWQTSRERDGHIMVYQARA